MSDEIILPGDKIAIIEEYESGKNTFDDGHNVRSTVIGKMEIDKKNRIAQVQNSKMSPVPQKDDIVIGTVAAVMSSMIAVSINYVHSCNFSQSFGMFVSLLLLAPVVRCWA